MSQNHEQEVNQAIERAYKIFRLKGFSFRAMQRIRPVAKNSSYVEGHTSFKDKTVTIDIYTARLRKPKKISAILAVLAHEVAHHQKLPYKQYHKGRWINRFHYPEFYKQVNKNVARLKKDKVLRQYY